jgi:predicted adenine nucleotide alpha hydrolase (AANH) superfamily ATPase
MLGIDLIEGEYDVENWLELVRGFEYEPEKGSRCGICFDRRFEVSAQKASDMGESSYTSTLLTSPKKSLEQLQVAGDALAKTFGIAFVAPDYRKASGTQEQNIMAKEDALYRQDYCGCMFALNIQRDQQHKLADELFVPISAQVQPESIEERIEMYEKRWELEDTAVKHKIIKQRFLNWRLTFGWLKVQKVLTPAHILPYSCIKGEYSRGKIEYHIGEVHHMNRDEVRFITLKTYNTLANTDYTNVTQLLFSPPPFADEVALRAKLGITAYDISLIMVVDQIPSKKIEIRCQSKTYDDVKEVLVNL